MKYLIITWMYINLLVLIDMASMSNVTSTNNRDAFLENLKSLNNLFIDPLYFCSSALIPSKSLQNGNTSTANIFYYWILRNKKCMNFSDTKLNFYEALRVCKRNNYYSSNSHLIHRKEIEYLYSNRRNHTVGLDILQIYSKLNRKQIKRLVKHTIRNTNLKNTNPNEDITIWLEDNHYADFTCNSKDLAPIVRYNNHKCQNGCFECEKRNSSIHYYICVKGVNYKVPLNSYCNTNDLSQYEIKNSNNLYFQASNQIYLCQGDLQCFDYVCKCKNNRKNNKDCQ
jgi:hypothetical protein